MTEHQIQSLAIQYLRMMAPDILIYAIPNGGLRNKLTAVRLKNEGVLAGIPDLHIPQASTFGARQYTSLYIEVKKPGGRLSQKQKDMHKRLDALGNKVVVAYTHVEIIQAIVNYFGPHYDFLLKGIQE